MESTSHGPVLIVEDDVDNRTAICESLTMEGYALEQAVDGLSALAYLASHRAPSLILLDWNMSPMNGAQFMTEFRKNPAYAQIPVVLLSAGAHAEEKAKHTFVSVLRKPVTLQALLEVLNLHCKAIDERRNPESA